AYEAMCQLGAAPALAAALLKQKVLPVLGEDDKRVAQLLADLDSETFATRERASTELQKLGEAVEPALQKALQDRPSAELRQRVRRLLDLLVRAASGVERLRLSRSLEVLERLATAEARSHLESLAQGGQSWLRHEARAVLLRVGKGIGP